MNASYIEHIMTKLMAQDRSCACHVLEKLVFTATSGSPRPAVNRPAAESSMLRIVTLGLPRGKLRPGATLRTCVSNTLMVSSLPDRATTSVDRTKSRSRSISSRVPHAAFASRSSFVWIFDPPSRRNRGVPDDAPKSLLMDFHMPVLFLVSSNVIGAPHFPHFSPLVLSKKSSALQFLHFNINMGDAPVRTYAIVVR